MSSLLVKETPKDILLILKTFETIFEYRKLLKVPISIAYVYTEPLGEFLMQISRLQSTVVQYSFISLKINFTAVRA